MDHDLQSAYFHNVLNDIQDSYIQITQCLWNNFTSDQVYKTNSISSLLKIVFFIRTNYKHYIADSHSDCVNYNNTNTHQRVF